MNSAEKPQVSACPVCGSEDTRSHAEHNLSECLGCDHVFQTDMTVDIVYDKDYVDERYAPDKCPLEAMAMLRAGFVLSKLGETGKRKIKVLDVGYGAGAFLKAISKKPEVEVYGIDVHGDDRGIEEVAFDSEHEFDAVTFFDSLEHFPSFDEVAKLKTRKIVVSIPRRTETFLKSPRTWRHYRPGEHLHYFSTQSMTKLMERLGYEFECEGDVEDLIRGRCEHEGQEFQNISTMTFRRRN